MPRVIKFGPADINPERLIEELRTAGFPDAVIPAVNRPGYDEVSDRRYTAAPARRVVTTIVSSGETTTIEADPRELWIEATRDLTVTESTLIDTTLAAHVYTIISQEQQRRDQDKTDRDRLLQLRTNLTTGWAGLSNAQRTETLREAVMLLGRLELREMRGEAI